jgi:hypothetical protein
MGKIQIRYISLKTSAIVVTDTLFVRWQHNHIRIVGLKNRKHQNEKAKNITRVPILIYPLKK